MSQTQALYRLQKLDTQIDTRRKRAREILAILDQDTALREARAAVEALQERLAPLETRVSDLNLNIQTVSEQSQQLSTQLYDGSVSNPKELEDIQKKIAERKRRHEHLENQLLETMLEVDDVQSALADATAHLDSVKADRASEYDTLNAELQQLKVALAQLKADRKAVASEISRANRALYKDIRAKRQGLAVVSMKGDSCSACGVRQTTTLAQEVRQGDKIVQCVSCGRILVAF